MLSATLEKDAVSEAVSVKENKEMTLAPVTQENRELWVPFYVVSLYTFFLSVLHI